jgi:CO dehydrogenase maturation factor
MAKTIAVAGKGGVGKTTIAALIIQELVDRRSSVLAVDADPSSNLHEALGLPLTETVGDVREEMLTITKAGKFPVGMAKQDYLDMKIQQLLIETAHGLDLLVMGRPEGPGCYCAANNMLRRCIDEMTRGYDFVVIDNEAGLEHLSRQTTRDVDVLIIVTDPTVKGITAAGRVKQVVSELRTWVGKTGLVVNRAKEDALSPSLREAIATAGLPEPVALVPENPDIGAIDAAGGSVVQLASDHPVRQSVADLARALGIISGSE